MEKVAPTLDLVGPQQRDRVPANGQEDIVYEPITLDHLQYFIRMEEACYPPDMVLSAEFFSKVLKQQIASGECGQDSSIIIWSGEKPVGYLLVVLKKSSKKNGEEVAYVYDIAVLPGQNRFKISMEMMKYLLNFAQNKDVAIEAKARASTSYALLINPIIKTWIEKCGFRLIVGDKITNHLGSEPFYFVRLEPIVQE